MFTIFVYLELIGPFSVNKHPRVNDLMIYSNRTQQPSSCFKQNVKKVISFLACLDSEMLDLKFLTYKLTILLSLTGSFKAHEIFYLDIRYSVRHNSSYIFQFSEITKTG